MVVGGQFPARLGKMIKKAEGDLLDNGLLDVQQHEAHRVRVGWLLKVVVLLDSLLERFAFAVGKEKEWGSASQSCFFCLNGIFSFWFKKTKQLDKQPTIKPDGVRISHSI